MRSHGRVRPAAAPVPYSWGLPRPAPSAGVGVVGTSLRNVRDRSGGYDDLTT